MHSRRHFIKVNGHEWAYLRYGSGKPLILVHGFFNYANFFNELGDHLFTDFELIIPDLPSFGFTKPLKETNTYHHISTELYAFTKAFGFSKMNFFGNSLGATVLLELSNNHPEIVEHLIINSPWWRKRGISLGKIEELEFKLADLSPELLKLLQNQNTMRSLIKILSRWNPKLSEIFGKNEGMILDSMVNLDVKGCVEIFHSLRDVELDNKIKRAKFPLMIIAGEKDNIISIKENITLAKKIKPLLMVVMKKEGHELIMSGAKKLAKLIKFFIKERPEKVYTKFHKDTDFEWIYGIRKKI